MISASMTALLDAQRSAFMAARPEDVSVRRDRLLRLKALLKDEGDALARAMSHDFGHRSHEQSLLTDIMPANSALNYALKHLRRLTRPERRRATFPLGLIGGRAEVRHEPKGVVGIVSPWNFPVVLAIGPLAQALAAGNRAMLKPSEFTPETSALLARAVASRFAPEELAIVTGGAEIGQVFCALPFDHLLFTGATAIGRHVARAAAENLVPVTLELGGKSPTIVGKGADVARAAERIAIGKMMNAGQICLAPDYLLVPADRQDAIVGAVAAAAALLYPRVLDNDDYTSIVNARHRDRLQGLIDDAVGKGAAATVVNPGHEDFAASNGHKLPLTILTGVDDTMAVMQEEIFGPVLPVLTYRRIDEAIDYVNAHDRPLGLYYFGNDADERERVLGRTISGGVTVNDVVMHIAMEDLPFGGIGPSGMGAYHGPEGFRTFSHARAVYHQPRWDIAALAGLKPPYGKATRATLARGLK
ncbi:coniferyl aldehyde dehydrogenase [Parablastomonas sp. CN1-191]|uniref:coniferyl aldehyde dehydrogenase n=1 Tax=Parablastomonas sp. CN1-191 TaxID=3400908 RepID=UPI003BF89B72